MLCAPCQAVGSFLKINRIRDAEGKPKGFGFVEYGDAESVLRCLALINGAQVTAADGEEKTLMVKADAKVRERLNTHEAGRMMTSVGLNLPIGTSQLLSDMPYPSPRRNWTTRQPCAETSCSRS